MSLISTSQITIVDLDDGRTQYTHLASFLRTLNQVLPD